MAITSNNDVTEFHGVEPVAETQDTSATGAAAPEVESDGQAGIWVLCRKQANGDVDIVRAFDDAGRARADLELAESVSGDEFWLSAVPLVDGAPADRQAVDDEMTRVQALALTWMAQGAEAEASVPLDEPVVVSPRHVRGFVSVPSHEWRVMEERGWVRDGLITPDGAEKVGQARKPHAENEN